MSQPGLGVLLDYRACAGIPGTAANIRPASTGGRNDASSGGGHGHSPVSREGRPRGAQRLDTVPPPARGTPGPEVATLVQGRFKRDDGAAADSESRGTAGHGPESRHPDDDTMAPVSSQPGATAGR